MAYLGVNIDHVATIRQARYRETAPGLAPEPDPVAAALLAEKAGAHGITVHLREDRRHIQEEDVVQLRRQIRTRLNLEMAVTPAMIATALKIKPDEVCLVPENRQEVTTEGGLDVAGKRDAVAAAVAELRAARIFVSLFVDPDLHQIEASLQTGAPCLELHTGTYAHAATEAARSTELARQKAAANLAQSRSLQVNAGHGLNYANVRPYLQGVPGIHTLNIGHAIVSRALFSGFETAVRDMVEAIQ
jgi:pyridoxine 5-phosphate synthase